jgi:hypothetical protein
MTRSLVAGSVTIDQTTGVETYVEGLAVYLYTRRAAVSQLPDPAHKRGCTTTGTASAGGTTIAVDTTAGYGVGDVLTQLDYVSPTLVDGAYPAASVELTIAAKTSNQFTFEPALPTGASIASALSLGFTGTDGEWQVLALEALIKTKTSIAAFANADAIALVDDFQPFCPPIVMVTTGSDASLAKFYPVATGQVISLRHIVNMHVTSGYSGGYQFLGEWDTRVAFAKVGVTLTAAYAAVITKGFGVGSAPTGPTYDATMIGSGVSLNMRGLSGFGLTWNISEYSL